jgi:hypothetical protein
LRYASPPPCVVVSWLESISPTKPDHPIPRRAGEETSKAKPASPTFVIMLRVAGRRISSHLAWRPAAAASAGRSPFAGGLLGDDSSRDQKPCFAVESPFYAAARGILPCFPTLSIHFSLRSAAS